MLLTREGLAKIISDYEYQVKELRLEVEKTQKERAIESASAEELCNAKMLGAAARLEAAQNGWEQERSIYSQALRTASSGPPWYESPYLNFLAGSVVAGGICAVSGAR